MFGTWSQRRREERRERRREQWSNLRAAASDKLSAANSWVRDSADRIATGARALTPFRRSAEQGKGAEGADGSQAPGRWSVSGLLRRNASADEPAGDEAATASPGNAAGAGANTAGGSSSPSGTLGAEPATNVPRALKLTERFRRASSSDAAGEQTSEPVRTRAVQAARRLGSKLRKPREATNPSGVGDAPEQSTSDAGNQ